MKVCGAVVSSAAPARPVAADRSRDVRPTLARRSPRGHRPFHRPGIDPAPVDPETEALTVDGAPGRRRRGLGCGSPTGCRTGCSSGGEGPAPRGSGVDRRDIGQGRTPGACGARAAVRGPFAPRTPPGGRLSRRGTASARAVLELDGTVRAAGVEVRSETERIGVQRVTPSVRSTGAGGTARVYAVSRRFVDGEAAACSAPTLSRSWCPAAGTDRWRGVAARHAPRRCERSRRAPGSGRRWPCRRWTSRGASACAAGR